MRWLILGLAYSIAILGFIGGRADKYSFIYWLTAIACAVLVGGLHIIWVQTKERVG